MTCSAQLKQMPRPLQQPDSFLANERASKRARSGAGVGSQEGFLKEATAPGEKALKGDRRQCEEGT